MATGGGGGMTATHVIDGGQAPQGASGGPLTAALMSAALMSAALLPAVLLPAVLAAAERGRGKRRRGAGARTTDRSG